MLPRLGVMNLERRLKQVVLPAPFGPINAWIVPRATRRLTPLSATKPANSLLRLSVWRINSSLTALRPCWSTIVLARRERVQQKKAAVFLSACRAEEGNIDPAKARVAPSAGPVAASPRVFLDLPPLPM